MKVLWAAGALLFGALVSGCESDAKGPPPEAGERTTYSIRYRVEIRHPNPRRARVRWELAGIDEIRYFRIAPAGDRFRGFSGTGTLETRDGEILWTPKAPYAHLEYEVELRHRRRNGEGFDSYADSGWVITRTQDLFPATHIDFDVDLEPEARSRAEVVFDLPPNWEAHSAMERTGRFSFRPEVPGKRHDRPKGWLALGELDVVTREAGETLVTIVRTRDSKLRTEKLLRVYEKAIPILSSLLERPPPRLLIVSGPDPMWRGALSGEDSIFIHGERPIRSRDKTSTPLHELFHVVAPFRPDGDGVWATEGLAEYYSLEIQHRAGLISDASFAKGLDLFREQGAWGRNLTGDRSLAVVNNSAPFVMAALDRAIRDRSKGERSLDDVVRQLAREEEHITTASFLRAVNAATGGNFTSFFQRHVYAGRPPALPES